MRVCVVGASGRLGQYLVRHALDRGHEVVAVCRAQSVGKLDGFAGRITVVPGATKDREVIRGAVAGCDGGESGELDRDRGGRRRDLGRALSAAGAGPPHAVAGGGRAPPRLYG